MTVTMDQIPDNVLIELVARYHEGDTARDCIDWLERRGYAVRIATLTSWLQRHGITKTSGAWGPVPAPSVEERVEQDVTSASKDSQIRYWRQSYQHVVKRAAEMNEVIAAIREVTPAIGPLEVQYEPYELGQATSPQTAVAPLCDTHIGEYVDPEQVGGLNAYDMERFNRRLSGWADQVLNLTALRKRIAPIPKLIVPQIGDMVSGDIHHELTKTNIDNVMGQMIRGAALIAQALIYLAPHFEEIYVPCVVGNHGRTTDKPTAKDRHVSWDYMTYQWIAAFCREQTNIKFSIPKSSMHVFQVEGRNVLMMHGDTIRMWQGVPHYGIQRTISQLRQVVQLRRGLEEEIEALLRRPSSSEEDLFSVLANYFSDVLLGHFHIVSETDAGTGTVHICGCMKGVDEYALGRLHTASAPRQVLLYYHPKHGQIGKDTIYLNRFDDTPSRFVDALPDVWIGRDGMV